MKLNSEANGGVCLELARVSRLFSTDRVVTTALSDINLVVQIGDSIAVTGPSGCGKSTLLSVMGMLDKPSSGTYKFNRIDVAELSISQLARMRNSHIGFVFQAFNLVADLSVFDNVAMPLLYRPKMGKREIRRRVMKVLEKLEVIHRRHHYPHQLSGGQQQRVAIARALVGNPAVLLADEPTGNLDSKMTDDILRLLLRLNEEGVTLCLATHDNNVAAHMQKIVEMADGKIV